MTLYIGNTPLSKAYIGSTELQKIYVGSTEVWSSWTPMGMLKSGTQNTAGSTTTVQVTGWVNNPSYPGSSVVSNALVISGAKSDASISASVKFVNRYFYVNYYAEIRKNGAAVPGASVTVLGPSSGTGLLITVPTVSVSVAAGDAFSLWVYTEGFGNTIDVSGTQLQVV